MERPLQGDNEAYLSNELKTHGLLRAVHEKVRIIAISDVEKIIRKDDSTGQAIVPVEETVTRLINMFRILRRCALDVLPASDLAGVLEICLRVNAVFDTIKTFDKGVVSSLGTPGTVNQIASQTDSVAQAAYQTLGLIIAKTFSLGDYFREQVDGAGEHFSKIMSLSFEAQETLNNVKRLARYEAANRFGDTFEQEAARHNRASWVWTICALAWAAGGISYLMLAQHRVLALPANVMTTRLAGLEILQIVLAGFVFYAMAFCAKNAISHRHNHTLNAHRRAVLSTANLFAEAAGTDAVKENIFAKAAEAASEIESTGFDKG